MNNTTQQMKENIKPATTKQINYLVKLGASDDQLKDIDIISASKLIRQLKRVSNKLNTISKEIKRSHNYKVGDILYMSWGYEQTNNNFFLITELVGKSSIRIKEIAPKLIKEDGVSGMSADRYYSLTDYTILDRSIFIEDNQKGELRRVLKRNYNGNEYEIIHGSKSGNLLYKYNGEKLYESWYY